MDAMDEKANAQKESRDRKIFQAAPRKYSGNGQQGRPGVMSMTKKSSGIISAFSSGTHVPGFQPQR